MRSPIGSAAEKSDCQEGAVFSRREKSYSDKTACLDLQRKEAPNDLRILNLKLFLGFFLYLSLSDPA